MQILRNFFIQAKTLLTYKTFQLFLVLVVLTSILILTTFLRPDIFQEMFSKISVFASDITTGRLWKEKSQAELFMEDGLLKVNFQISPDDQPAIKIFNQKLRVSEDYLQGIALKIDRDSEQKLQSYLPLNLILDIETDRITFQSGLVPGFVSSFVTETKEIATGSSKLKLSQYSPTEFALEIRDPEPLLQYATASGQFVLSDKLSPVYPILERISTIEMSVNGKSLSGEVRLK